MRAIIIDDEIHAIENLKSILDLFDYQIEILATSSAIDDAVVKIDQLKPDLLFLDIEMPNGNGFELLDRTSFKEYQVIFITAYSHYAIKALRMNALDYITKPIDPDDLAEALKKASKNKNEKLRPNFKPLMEGQNSGKFEKLGVPTLHGIRYLKLEDIIRMQASSNYTEIYIKKERPMLVSKTLKYYEHLLCPSEFIRVHQSHMVNLSYVESYQREANTYLILSNGDRVTVSKANRAAVSKILKSN